MRVARWRLLGWPYEPRNSRELRLVREGKPAPKPLAPLTHDGTLRPCRRCGSYRITIRHVGSRDGKPRLGRGCMDCMATAGRNRYRVARGKKPTKHRVLQRVGDPCRHCARPIPPSGRCWSCKHARMLKRLGS